MIKVPWPGACSYANETVSTFALGTCTITATAAGDAVGDAVSEAATVTMSTTVVPGTAEVSIWVSGRTGELSTSTPFVGEGTQLLPGSTMTVTAYSEPVVIGSAAVAADGHARVAATLPALRAGTHRVVVAGVGLDGVVVEHEVSLSVSRSGAIIWVGTAPTGRASGAALAATGADLQGADMLAALWLVVGAGLLVMRRTLLRRRRVAFA